MAACILKTPEPISWSNPASTRRFSGQGALFAASSTALFKPSEVRMGILSIRGGAAIELHVERELGPTGHHECVMPKGRLPIRSLFVGLTVWELGYRCFIFSLSPSALSLSIVHSSPSAVSTGDWIVWKSHWQPPKLR